MDLFKFTPNGNAGEQTILQGGQAINRALSIKWVERYRDPGEFEIRAKLSSGLLAFLPLDTLISHTNTYEVMIVENHEINETQDSDADIVITGRSFDSFLEHRAVGQFAVSNTPYLIDYTLGATQTWFQAAELINGHIGGGQPIGFNLTNVRATTSLPVGGGVSEQRSFKHTDVHTQLMQLLAIDDCGIRTVRRSTFPSTPGNSTETLYIIYKGVNRTASVKFSWERGEIIGADYLWSTKKLKNVVLVTSTYFQYFGQLPGDNSWQFDKRFMALDASDIDRMLTAVPPVQDQNTYFMKLYSRGIQALQDQKKVTITRADISPLSNYVYRRDYGLGDLVLLDGSFGVTSTMRVIEHVEIQDETGTSGHPTLSVPTTV